MFETKKTWLVKREAGEYIWYCHGYGHWISSCWAGCHQKPTFPVINAFAMTKWIDAETCIQREGLIYQGCSRIMRKDKKQKFYCMFFFSSPICYVTPYLKNNVDARLKGFPFDIACHPKTLQTFCSVTHPPILTKKDVIFNGQQYFLTNLSLKDPNLDII